jgi:glycosyltransferase involved in cell wall biosynthesis
MRTAIIADWLPTFGGAEHVVAALHRLFPDAPIFTTVARHERIAKMGTNDVRVSRLQTAFCILRTHTLLLPWMPRAMERIDLRDYDLVLSSSHAVGKGIIPSSSAVHVCYCHTPMRYAWDMEESYLEDFRVPHILRKTVQRCLMRIRRWDMTVSKRVDVFIANSTTTQERIQRLYGRPSTVVHPPIEERFFHAPLPDKKPADRDYFLALGRLVPYKRFDLLMKTANRLRLPLKIAGTGSDLGRLRKMAGPTVELLGFVHDEKLPSLYSNARALLFPQIEDAGVAALEAQACGTPVIALGKGGALDTVIEGKTGTLFPEQSVESLEGALQRWQEIPWDPEDIRKHAAQFREEIFLRKINAIVQGALDGHQRHIDAPPVQ